MQIHAYALRRVVAAASLFALLASTASQLGAADLPIREVVLYKHGIGYFEREGTVAQGEEARLDFKNSEMNDVLKSLIVTDGNGFQSHGNSVSSLENSVRRGERMRLAARARPEPTACADASRIDRCFVGCPKCGTVPSTGS